jgi:periplasmic protein CpxP/Spy
VRKPRTIGFPTLPLTAYAYQKASWLVPAQLAITPAQMPQWTAFAQVMRENARTTDALFRQRAAGVQSMNAAENTQSYAQLSRAYGDGNEKLAAAFQASYAMLSDQQKQAADTLFRQQAAQSAQIPVVKLR